MLDRYWFGAADRVSPEAPVPVVRVEEVEERPGGAANVALNIVSMGARCTLVGAVGADEGGQLLRQRLEAAGVECDFLELDDWSTIVKMRLLAQHQQLVRADFEQPLPLAGSSERQAMLLNKVEKHLVEATMLVLEDYDKGVIDEPQALIRAARNCSVPVIVDPKMKPLAAYRGASVVKPNEKEFLHATGEEADITQVGPRLCEELDLVGLLVTRGGSGMDVVTRDQVRHIAARSVEVFDVTGAGDTAAASLALGLSVGWTFYDAAALANIAASIAVSKTGTSPVTGPEISRALAMPKGGYLNVAELQGVVEAARAAGERIVFTNGCFDILHAGHVTYLEEARALGSRLIVAINDDASVRALKGEGRPVISLAGRSRVLEGLSCVDWVVSFAEQTPEKLLEAIRPDVLVKGGDYAPDQVVGADIVTGYGGEVRVLSLVQDVSTTAIVDRIRSVH